MKERDGFTMDHASESRKTGNGRGVGRGAEDESLPAGN